METKGYTTAQVAGLLGVTEQRVLSLIKEHEADPLGEAGIKGTREGRAWLISREALLRYRPRPVGCPGLRTARVVLPAGGYRELKRRAQAGDAQAEAELREYNRLARRRSRKRSGTQAESAQLAGLGPAQLYERLRRRFGLGPRKSQRLVSEAGGLAAASRQLAALAGMENAHPIFRKILLDQFLQAGAEVPTLQ